MRVGGTQQRLLQDHWAPSEHQFQAAVMELARALGWKVAHFHDSRRQVRPGVMVGDRDAAGFPDLVLARAPRLLIIELKAEKGRVSVAQKDWMTVLHECGVEVSVWRPSDWDSGLIERTLAR